MLEIYRRLALELSAGRPVGLATIIQQLGSSPRSQGSKMLICQDGSLLGSIGGGLMEAQAIREARNLLGGNTAVVLPIRLSGREVAGTDMICGGNVDVLVQGVSPADGLVTALYQNIVRCLDGGRRGVLAAGPLPSTDRPGPTGLLWAEEDRDGRLRIDGQAWPGEITGQAEMLLKGAAEPQTVVQAAPGSFLVELVTAHPVVMIFGAGHISVNLARILDLVHFQVVVIDDRAEFANRDRFPMATGIVVADYDACFDQLNPTPDTYCVIVTRGHLHDKTVLQQLLARSPRYVGMIGSRRKRTMIYEALMQEGVAPERLKTVHSPIGLDIGAETPEEIAVAIAAEIIRIRRTGNRPDVSRNIDESVR